MLFLALIITLYLLACYRLDKHYSGRYFWDTNCHKEKICTNLLQPFMELLGNGMTAHFWHFRTLPIKNCNFKPKFELKLQSNRPATRIFSKGLFLSIITSIWVDINPFQRCAVIKPVYSSEITPNTLWKIWFMTGTQTTQEEKCSHFGTVKIVVDGQGGIFGRETDGNFIELEVVTYCKAYQNTHILFV